MVIKLCLWASVCRNVACMTVSEGEVIEIYKSKDFVCYWN